MATDQVEDGRPCVSHIPVRLIERPHLYLRITAYVTGNDRRLDELSAWDEVALASQRFVLGRVEGVELDLPRPGGGELTVFTPHADALALAHFVLLSPRHPDVDSFAQDAAVRERRGALRS